MIISVAEKLADKLNYQCKGDKVMYLDAVQITFRENNQLGKVNVSAENLEGFLRAHPDYEIISKVYVRCWIL